MKTKHKHGDLTAELEATHGPVWHELNINVDDHGVLRSTVIGISGHLITIGDIRLSESAADAFRAFVEKAFSSIDEMVKEAKKDGLEGM